MGSIIALMDRILVVFITFSMNDMLCFDRSVPGSNAAMIEGIILSMILAVLAIYRHKDNIGRLMRHEENKLSFHKSEE